VLLVLLFSGVAGSWNGVLQRVLMTVLLLWIAISQRAADPTLPHPATRARALIPTPVDGRLEVVDFEGHVAQCHASHSPGSGQPTPGRLMQLAPRCRRREPLPHV
jgi:hypothetical protein